MKNVNKKNYESEIKAAGFKGIGSKEFDFMRSYADLESPLFGNAYRSALKAGYSESYARVIRRHYGLWRRKWLNTALKNKGLMMVIEATRPLPFNKPTMNEKKMKRLIRKREREVYGMSAEELIKELDNLLKWGI